MFLETWILQGAIASTLFILILKYYFDYNY